MTNHQRCSSRHLLAQWNRLEMTESLFHNKLGSAYELYMFGVQMLGREVRIQFFTSGGTAHSHVCRVSNLGSRSRQNHVGTSRSPAMQSFSRLMATVGVSMNPEMFQGVGKGRLLRSYCTTVFCSRVCCGGCCILVRTFMFGVLGC